MMKKLCTIVLLACSLTSVHAQTVPVVTYSDFAKFDALKADVARAGFKVQIQLDGNGTGTWFDIAPAALSLPVVLPDTLPDSVTYQLPIAASTPPGVHRLYLRYCVVDNAQTTCGPSASVQFDLRTTAPTPVPTPPGAPGNLRFGPKSGGGIPDAVDAFGWLNDVPRAAGMMGRQ